MSSTSFDRSRPPCCSSSGDSGQRSFGRYWSCLQIMALELHGLITSYVSSAVRFVDVII